MNSLLRIKITGQAELIRKAHQLETLDTRAILDQGAALMFNRMRTRFLQEISPTGEKWPRSRAAEYREKKGRGGGTLFESGKLWRSLQIYADSDTSRAIGTNATSSTGFPYPVVHQKGLGGFPRREFLGFGDEDFTLMSEFIVRKLKEALL